MKVIDLDLLIYQPNLIIRSAGDQKEIFDPIRKKYVWLGPEEYVRQLIIQFLIIKQGISKNKLAVEKQIKLNALKKRFDIVIYDQKLNPYCLIECKAHSHKIVQGDIDQLIIYNMQLNANYILISNGVESYLWSLDSVKGGPAALDAFVLEV